MEKMTVEQFIKNCNERNLVLEKLLEQNKVAERRIYSVNLASYLCAKGYDCTIHKDEDKEDLFFFVFRDDVTDEIEEYKNNTMLQDFIRSYREVKKKLHIAKIN